MENSNKKNKFLPNKKTKNLIKEEPIYVMTIELDQGKSGNLPIFLNSNPEELSFNFCKQYNLDYSSMDFLKNQIIKFKNEFINSDNNIFTPTIEEVDEESTRQVSNNKLNKEIMKLNVENNTKNNNNIDISSNNNDNNSNKLITNKTNSYPDKNNIINNNKIQNKKINSQSNSKSNSQINSQINSQVNSPKKNFENNFILKKNTVNPEKMIRKNPNLQKNKTKKKIKKYIETNQNKKEKTPNEKKSKKKFISLNKQKINPVEHTLFSYERFFNNLKEKMEKRKSRNKSFELNKINKSNLPINLNEQSLNLLIIIFQMK
jgi:hypothetical protein